MKAPVLPVLFLLLSLSLTPALAQTKPFALTVDNIMRGNELVGYAPRNIVWSPDSKQVYFEWKKASEPTNKPYDHFIVNADGSGMRLLTEDEVKALPPSGGEPSPDKRYKVYSERGDIVLYEPGTNTRKLLTETEDFEESPEFTRDGSAVLFTRENNLFSLSRTDGAIRQLTDIRTGSPPPTPAPESKGTSQAGLKKTEQDLFSTIRERARQRDEEAAKPKPPEKRKPFYLPAGQFLIGFDPSADGERVALTLRANDGSGRNTIVPRFVTDSGYTEAQPGRTNVGDPQGYSRITLLQSATGEAHPIEFTPPPITAVGVPNGPRRITFYNFRWSEDGKHAVVMASADDYKDAWILEVDPATGKTRVLAQQHDDAWIGPLNRSTLGFLPDNRRIYFVSERTGFAHLYTLSIEDGATTALTQGKFEVYDVRLSSDKTRFYFTSNEEGTGDRSLYSISVDGGKATRITRLSDADEDDYRLAPDEKTIAVIRSESNRPPELFLTPNRPDPSVSAVQITHSPTPEWLSYPWIRPPLVTFPARDGAKVTARLFKSPKWKKGGPAVLFVHGAGYLQNAHNWWSHYFREYMFHHLLMERGYLVLDMDYRGSSGYGRDWRTGIYRHMGGKDLEDEVDGAKWLVSTYGVDAKRIGLYGGSYGGFLTLMAMFTAPDVFASGAALRPVTDWAHYNHGYTAAILNQPQHDTESYRRSSPIFFAEGLKGSLLICHGMVDDNVHFQDSVRLAQRLIELRKENWELAGYPVESHAFTEATSWADEYRRILKLFETTLKRP